MFGKAKFFKMRSRILENILYQYFFALTDRTFAAYTVNVDVLFNGFYIFKDKYL